MPQIFHRSANTIAKASILGIVLLLGGLGWYGAVIVRSPWTTRVGLPLEQPVPFSHQHHVEGLGIDCRYCHTSVENSSFAGIPPTQTCMNCHSIMWNKADLLAPVRESLRTQEPIQWVRVHDLPDFVFFDHSIHIAKGVACITCHGNINEMPLTWRANTLRMEWCLSCHKAPEKRIGPKDRVFDVHWKRPADFEEKNKDVIAQAHLGKVTNCTICHR